MAYKVVTVPVGCCGTIKEKELESTINSAEGKGYELIESYIDTRGSCCKEKCVFLILRKTE